MLALQPLSSHGDIMSFTLLQAYSQDAYLKGNEAYSGNAQNIPDPPPICYPRIEAKSAGAAQTSEPPTAIETARGPARAAEKSYRVEISVPPSPPPQQTSKSQTAVCVFNENARTVAAPPDPVDRASRSARAGPSHRTEENRYGPSLEAASARPLVASVHAAAQLQFAPSRPTETPVYSPSPSPSSSSRPGQIYPDTLSPPVRTPLTPASPDTLSAAISPNANHYSPSPTATSTSPHQNIDWRNYTTYKDYIDSKRLHTYGCRTIQERLDSLRAAASSSSAYSQQRTPPPPSASQRAALSSQVRRRSASHDRGVGVGCQGPAVITPLRSASQERLGSGAERAARNWPRSASQDALPSCTPAGVTKPRARSCDYLGQRPGESGRLASGDGVGCSPSELEDKLLLCRGEEAGASRQGAGLRASQPIRSLTGQEEEGRGNGLSDSPLAAPVFTKGTMDSVLTSRTDSLILRPSRLPVKHSVSDTSPAADPLKDQRSATMGNHLGYPSPLQHLQLRVRADSLKMESRAEPGLGVRSSSCSGPSTANGALTQRPRVTETSSSTDIVVQTNGGPAVGVEGPDATVVVLRRDRNSGPYPIRHPSYILAVNDNEGGHTHAKSPLLVKTGSADGGPYWAPNDTPVKRLGDARQTSRSKNLDDSLDSIPFIGKLSRVTFTCNARYHRLKS